MKKYAFDAEIQPGRSGGAYVAFPYDVHKEFGTNGKVPVNVTIGGVPDRGALMRMGLPRHILGVPKAIRERLGKKPGDTVAIELWKDDAPRELAVPPELEARMKKARVREFFDSLSFTSRKEYCRFIAEAKKDETRARRLDKAIELLANGVRSPR